MRQGKGDSEKYIIQYESTKKASRKTVKNYIKILIVEKASP